jgi:hypothetical protein
MTPIAYKTLLFGVCRERKETQDKARLLAYFFSFLSTTFIVKMNKVGFLTCLVYLFSFVILYVSCVGNNKNTKKVKVKVMLKQWKELKEINNFMKLN